MTNSIERTKRKKGELTKKNIYSNAKELFYEYGFKGVTMKKIAEKSRIAGGNLTYYYPSKNDIGVQIIREFLNEIIHFVDASFPELTRIFDRHFYNTMILDCIVFSDPKYMLFYKEILENNTMSGIFDELVEHVYLGLIEEFNLRITHIQYKFIKIADSGARRESFLTLYKENLKIPPKDYAVMVYENTCRLIGVPSNEFPRAAFSAFNNMDKLDYSHIKLL